MTHIRQICSIFDIAILHWICSNVISMVPFTHAAFFVLKNHVIKRGLEQNICMIKKSWRIHLMCVMALRTHTSIKRFCTKSSGRVLTKPSPQSLVKDCHNCNNMFSLRTADFDSSSSMSKAAICSRLSVSLEAGSKKIVNFRWKCKNIW